MVQTVAAGDVDLALLAEKFGLKRSDAPDFFREWQDDLPELGEVEKGVIAEIKADYLYLSQHDVLEPLVKMVVLGPLLKLAGFYRPPFWVVPEKKVELLTEDKGTLVRGLIDILVLHQQIWVVAIEAKRSEYALKAAIPQALFYLLGQPVMERSAYGLITNGNEFRFLKLRQDDGPRYDLSYILSVEREDDLQRVLRILKRLAQLAMQRPDGRKQGSL